MDRYVLPAAFITILAGFAALGASWWWHAPEVGELGEAATCTPGMRVCVPATVGPGEEDGGWDGGIMGCWEGVRKVVGGCDVG
ncbi:uncharacterized protein F4812DRAFT_460147 [Daldinia caldariorum]|uniref:uncharacterized protein n=1 Tax=Daldinia caldariorum TaxID=326644 RepID=UPI002008D884|nr:uncharacterized protein F4812DRAFT_460147 [Daldinia caldariorum]KAI1467299.1 hypothetical protein F4812DRAFT_460147 [Daldinia caldariorum]